MSDKNNPVSGGTAADEDLEKIMQEIISEETNLSETKEATVQDISTAAKAGKIKAEENTEKQTLSLELSGSINLKLYFSSGERSIEVSCGEDAMICRLADGSEFRIPFGTVANNKKSA